MKKILPVMLALALLLTVGLSAMAAKVIVAVEKDAQGTVMFGPKLVEVAEGATAHDALLAAVGADAVVGYDSDYGFYITGITKDGETLSEDGTDWDPCWNFYLNGQAAATGLSSHVAQEGDVIRLILKGFEAEAADKDAEYKSLAGYEAPVAEAEAAPAAETDITPIAAEEGDIEEIVAPEEETLPEDDALPEDDQEVVTNTGVPAYGVGLAVVLILTCAAVVVISKAKAR